MDKLAPVDADADADADDYLFAFAPVPGRARRDGWATDRQRGFIETLRTTGVVASAARAVGMSAVSAYKLRQRAGATEFVDAWDRAMAEARCDALDLAMERATRGVIIPRTYRGRFVGIIRRFDDRLALAALRYADRAVAVKVNK